MLEKKGDLQIGLKLWTSMQWVWIPFQSFDHFYLLRLMSRVITVDGCKGQTFCNSRPHYRTAIMEPLTLFLVQHFKWIIRLRSRFLSHLDNFATQIHVFIWQPLVSDKVMLQGVSFHAMVLPLNTWPVTSKCKDQSWKCSHTALTELAKHLWQHDFEGRTRKINSQHAIFYST